MRIISLFMLITSLVTASVFWNTTSIQEQAGGGKQKKTRPRTVDDPQYAQYGIYEKTAPRAEATEPRSTRLPLQLNPHDRIALIGNTLLEREQHFGYFETLIHQNHPRHSLVVRNLAWSGDTVTTQPRPANFADLDQHLTHEKADVILAAFGFSESFAGVDGIDQFRQDLSRYVSQLKSKAFNRRGSPRIVLISPIANENVDGVAAADLNNANIQRYVQAMREVAGQQQVGFIDVYGPTLAAMLNPDTDLTINGCHLNDRGYQLLADTLIRSLFDGQSPDQQLVTKHQERLRREVLDKNRQFFRRYRPVNTFYYTGNRNKSYGYLDFLPAMRNFDLLVQNRDQRIWSLSQGNSVPETSADGNVPALPKTKESRGANRWMTADDELRAFKVHPDFEVNLFAGEEQFPDIAAPIQMRWDARGRLWVSCSTTYPHVYPGNEPNDKLVILEDTDGDGKADTSQVFADDLHIPLSFEFGDGGVYVSEMPHLTFLKDTDGDGKADVRRRLLTGFGTEDSHHSLHDFVWSPDGDLIFRESVFHHSQVETPYGPVRQQNSGWFRFEPRHHRLTSFGTYSSTNPWGVTFDDWGQHVASHPIYAAAFHALDPPYPAQHPRPAGLRAYSGTCGQEFVDFATFPSDLQGGYIKARYKPTNRIEIHRWKEGPFGFDEEYVEDLIFSSNLSFIPVDIRFGPRGALYVCDWYNPVKGHAQYSLRDERRDRHSGRIWRVTAKNHPLVDPPQIEEASVTELLDLLKRKEYRYRYWAKRRLREHSRTSVKAALDQWVAQLSDQDPRFRHHQLEALWVYRSLDVVADDLLRELLDCKQHLARAAAVEQLRFWHPQLDDSIGLLRQAINDPNAIVRMQAAIAASYIGSEEALTVLLEAFNHPVDGHLAYALNCALGSHTLKRHWDGNPKYDVAGLMNRAKRSNQLREPTPSAREAQFDSQPGLKAITISCLPERMRYSVDHFAVTVGQPVKILFTNPDATDHNLVIVRPGALEEVGMAANEMARDPRNANSDFIPRSKRELILQASPMIGPTRDARVDVLRFTAPSEPGIYPFVCTFPGHWVVMKGEMIVVNDLEEVPAILAKRKTSIVKQWTMDDFAELPEIRTDEATVMRGMQAFQKARCNQCHVISGHGINLGPDLTDVVKRFQHQKLLRQLIEPSSEINEKYRNHQFALKNGEVVTGVIIQDERKHIQVVSNLLLPQSITRIRKRDIDEQIASRLSPMPEGLVDVLEKQEIIDLLGFLQAGGFKLPDHLDHRHH